MYNRSDTMKPKLFGMIPDFPIDIRIRFAELKLFLLLPDFAKLCPVGLLSFYITNILQQALFFASMTCIIQSEVQMFLIA